MHATLRIREAQASDRDLLARWATAMAWETEHKRLDAATISAGIEAGLADPAKARYYIAMSEIAVAGRETIAAAAGTLMLTREWSDWHPPSTADRTAREARPQGGGHAAARRRSRGRRSRRILDRPRLKFLSRSSSGSSRIRRCIDRPSPSAPSSGTFAKSVPFND